MFPVFYFIPMNTYGKVFCHFSLFHHFNANGFKCIGEINQWLVTV